MTCWGVSQLVPLESKLLAWSTVTFPISGEGRDVHPEDRGWARDKIVEPSRGSEGKVLRRTWKVTQEPHLRLPEPFQYQVSPRGPQAWTCPKEQGCHANGRSPTAPRPGFRTNTRTESKQLLVNPKKPTLQPNKKPHAHTHYFSRK